MRLLLDENLSEQLVSRLSDLFPRSLHVRLLDLSGATDEQLWHLAKQQGCTLLTRDEDFLRLSAIHGAPPKVILLRLGNCSTAEVAEIVRSSFVAIRTFQEDPELSGLELRRTNPPSKVRSE